MSDMNTCKLTKTGNIMTPRSRMGFPFLFEPQQPRQGDSGKPKYRVTIVIPDKADIALLKKAAAETAKAKWGDKLPKNLKSPFLKAGDCEGDKGKHFPDELDDWTVLRVSSVQKPGIVGPRGEAISEESEVYAGRWCRASLRPFAYDTNGNKGISFGLQNIQLLEHDEAWGGVRARAEDEFEPVEVGEGDVFEGSSSEEGESGDEDWLK